MSEKMFFKTRLYFTGVVTIAIWALLAWNHYHGGVPSHNILAREDLPAISNWWGGILLPLLTWFLLYRIQKRIIRHPDEKTTETLSKNIIYTFAFSLLFGILLSAFFTYDYENVPGYMINGLLILALFFPIYRAECLLGFVIGMTFTFGAVLPTAVGSLLALLGLVIYRYVRPVILYLASKFMHIIRLNNHKTSR